MKNLSLLKSKRPSMLLFVIFCAFYSCIAQDTVKIKLSLPNKEGGKPLMQTLNERHSSREYTDKALTDQQLSDLLWAAYGINRPEEGKRTAPSARNRQEIDLYITTPTGAYIYDAVNHSLIELTKKDIRAETGNQEYSKTAAVNILYVLNKDKAADKDEDKAMICACLTSGAIMQNVYLYCASENLGCVLRGFSDTETLKTALKLNDRQKIVTSQSVGVMKAK
jgi:SagB-type dehydrogenase family enzyme